MIDPTSSQAIGKVETALGSVSVRRGSGAVVQVDVGDLVYHGDVIETAADGRVGLRFIDDTAFELSNSARMVLKEFAFSPNEPANSAVFSLARGAYAFIAGKVAKTGNFWIDTPFASIRSRDQGIGIGIGVLSLAALAFSMRDALAGPTDDLLLDYDTITWKDLGQNGVFEVTIHKDLLVNPSVPQVFVIDDPGQMFAYGPNGASSTTNSTARMVELQAEQQSANDLQAVGLQLGPTSTGSHGSPTFYDFSPGFIPINFVAPQNINTTPQNFTSGPNTIPTFPVVDTPQILPFEAPSILAFPVKGVGGTALGLSISKSGNTTSSSLVIGSIPIGEKHFQRRPRAQLHGDGGDTSVDVNSWNLPSLAITTTSDRNFTLTVTATAVDDAGTYQYGEYDRACDREPFSPPTVSWGASTPGTEGTNADHAGALAATAT